MSLEKSIDKIVSRPLVILAAMGVIGGGALALGVWGDRLPDITARNSEAPATSRSNGLIPTSLVLQDDEHIVRPSPSVSLQAINDEMADIAEQVMQAVVHIQAGSRQRGGGSGSGFIIRSDGWIVTNDHVITGFDEVTVTLADGREFRGTVRRANDPAVDIAVVKIEEDGLPTLAFDSVRNVRPGQFAIAVGSPFELENSVTIGHVSAVGRTGAAGVFDPRIGTFRGYNSMIQTDASINPGNSGGPLINIHGRVIGVNSTIYSQTGGNMGIGFAIPAEQAEIVATLLIERGEAVRSFMGVIPEDLRPFERNKFGVNSGAILRTVNPGTPAYQAGLRDEDIVTQIGDQEIRSELDLRIAMYRVTPDSEVPVRYRRNGETRETRVRVQAAPQEVAMAPRSAPRSPFTMPEDIPGMPEAPRTPPQARPTFGVTIESLTDANRRNYRVPSAVESGVVVTAVAPNSLAARIGIQPGEIIVEFNGRQINEPSDLSEEVQAQAPGNRVQVRSVRIGENGEVIQRMNVLQF